MKQVEPFTSPCSDPGNDHRSAEGLVRLAGTSRARHVANSFGRWVQEIEKHPERLNHPPSPSPITLANVMSRNSAEQHRSLEAAQAGDEKELVEERAFL